MNIRIAHPYHRGRAGVSPMRIQFAAFFCCFLVWAMAATPAAAKNRALPPSYDASGLLKINLDYYELAAATGGDFYFWGPGEFSASGIQIPLEQEPILLVYDVLGRRTRSFWFPVDTVSERFSVFAGAQRKDVFQLIRPSGGIVAEGETDVLVQEFHHMLIVTVTKPELGIWRIDLNGAGRFSLSVRLRMNRVRAAGGHRTEPLAVIDFDFVELRGRPGHEGYFPITGEVGAGEDRLCQVVLSGAYETADFQFVSTEDELLAGLDLARDDPDGASDEFLGSCVIPAQPFRLKVRGRDAWGVEYQRMYSPLYTPKN